MISRIFAIDAINGITYIGKSSYSYLNFSGTITIEDYVVVPTSDLKSEEKKSYLAKVNEAYDSLKRTGGRKSFRSKKVLSEIIIRNFSD